MTFLMLGLKHQNKNGEHDIMKIASTLKTTALAAVSLIALGAAGALAAEAESCGKVRFSDFGWTDSTVVSVS